MTQSLTGARVRSLRLEADNIISVELVPVDGESFPSFTAGAHVDLHLANGLVRSYSLLNSGGENRYMLGILNDPQSRGGSRYVHETLRCGMELAVSAPRNNFILDESAEESVLVAGGIGVTPILAMYRRLAELERKVRVVYCARSRKQAAFLEKFNGLHVLAHFDDEHDGKPFDLDSFLARQPKEIHAYCCGPAPMIHAFEAACAASGIRNVHVERFGADTTALQEAQKATGSYTVYLKRRDRSIEVPAGTSLLDALLGAGVDCDHSCRDGVCGTCETVVLEGQVDHRDLVLSDSQKAANRTMMICVSALKAGEPRLVLDI